MASDDNCECPLCMEPFEVDDTSFYPCTCGYQICRFCWHRLKIDGNGLCPACRKAYSENPAHFEPLSEDEIVRIKKERRHKEVQKKQKLTENRRHLSDVRVVQKNLVFVVGLSHRLADSEILKKTEYFGKFGKITKVVINSSPSYAGAQTPSASAYVTYSKPEEALKAIQTVNNVQIDNRVLKASLGTTKYCSHFLKGIQCPKNDCMYLHDLGEDNASFTKEQMSQGKHLEYESRLIESVLHIPRNLQNISNDQANQIIINQIHQGLPSANLNHSSNLQNTNSEATQASNSNNNSNTSSSMPTTSSNNNNTNNTHNSAGSSNNLATTSNTNNTNKNYDKNETKSRLKKSSNHTSKHNQKSSNSIESSQQQATNKTTSNNKTHAEARSKSRSNDYESNTRKAKNNNTDEEEYDAAEPQPSDEQISEEEARTTTTNSNETKKKEEKLTSNASTKPTTTTTETTKSTAKNSQKSYLAVLNTDDGTGVANNDDSSQTTKTQINYKEVLEKNIPVNTNETETNNQNESNDLTTTLQQTPINKEQNDEDSNNFMKSLSMPNQHIVQEEDLGFDPWDEATKSLQDLMKIELNVNKPTSTSSQADNSAKSNNIEQAQQKTSNNNYTQNYNSTTATAVAASDEPLNINRQQFNNFPPNMHPAMFKNDLQSFYKLHPGTNNNPLEFNQLYLQNAMLGKDLNGLTDTNTQQKLNEMLLASSGVASGHNNFMNGINNTDFTNGALNHENYLNKLLLQKQNLAKQSNITAPPGFNNNNIVFNSPNSNSTTSSSSSSTSSSVNNSTSTTPALNANLQNNNNLNHNNNSTNTNKVNSSNACLMNDFTNDFLQETAKQDNKASQLNGALFSNSLQDTFRSIFPNANISFGGAKSTNQSTSNNKVPTNQFDGSKLTNNFQNNNNNNNNNINKNSIGNQLASGVNDNKSSASQNIWPDDPAIVSLNNGLNGQPKDLNAQLAELQERVKNDFDYIYNNNNNNNNNSNKHFEQLSYLTSSLSQQQQQQYQPNNLNNLTNLLKKQQNDQFNNSLINQFQALYQQHHLAQFQNSPFLNHTNQNPTNKNSQDGQMMNNNSSSTNGNNNSSINKSIEDFHNHQQKLLLLNNGNHFNGLNGNTNHLLNNYLNNDFNQFTNTNGYNFMMDSNRNIQANLNGGLKSQNTNSNNHQANGMNNSLPPLLNMQQQSYMQQLLMQSFNTNPTAATSNANTD